MEKLEENPLCLECRLERNGSCFDATNMDYFGKPINEILITSCSHQINVDESKNECSDIGDGLYD